MLRRWIFHALCSSLLLATTADVLAKPARSSPAAPRGPSITKDRGRLKLPIRFRRVGIEAGLPTSAVFHIAQDNAGFVWLGTQAGLVKYDGLRMTTYGADPGDPDSLPDSTVTALAADDRGAVWVGTSLGLSRFDPATGHFVHYKPNPNDQQAIRGTAITALHATEEAVWVGTDEGINRLDLGSGEFKFPPDLREYSSTTIISTKDGRLLIGTQQNGLLIYDTKAEKLLKEHAADPNNPDALSEDHVTALAQDATGTVWLGTKSTGLNALNLESGKFAHFRARKDESTALGDDHITALLSDPNGVLWIGTEGDGLNALDKERKSFTRAAIDTEVESRLAFQWVLALYRDREGVTWVGALAGGLSMFDSLSAGLAAHSLNETAIVMSFFEEQNGRLWVGTGPSQEGSGLYRINLDSLKYTHYTVLGPEGAPGSVDLRNYYLTVLQQDEDGILWIGTEKAGLIAFDPDSEDFRHYPMKKPDSAEVWSSDVFSLAKVGKKIWLGTWGGGLVSFDSASGAFEQFAADPLEDSGLKSNHIYRVLKDVKDSNILWLGTADQGLAKFDIKQKTFLTYSHDAEKPDSLSHNAISCIYQEPSGVLWLGTYGGGLNRLDPESGAIKQYTKKNGLSPGTIYGVLPDDKGRLWLSTDGNGIWMVDPKDDSFQGYTASDGLQSDEYAYRSSHLGRSGRLYFGGPHGFNAFNPKEIKADDYVPPVVLTGMSLFGKAHDLGEPLSQIDKLSLDYDDSVFSIEFAGLSFADPARIRYEYLLEGFRDEWIKAERGFVPFTNLDPGNYTLHVRATGRHQATSAEPATLAIHIEPPLWRTWWAYLIYVGIIAGIVVAYLRYQAQRVKALEQENRLLSVEKDLELTAAVQTGFLPQESALNVRALNLFGFYRAADKCSGDWWWYERGNGDRCWVLVGDVTGHGPGPAMVTAAVGTAFRVSAGVTSKVMDRLETINDEVRVVGQGRYHMVITLFDVDENTGEFILYGAGGMPALHMTADGNVKPIMVRGTPVGSSSFNVGQKDGKLETGDRILLFTDGLPEIKLPSGRLMGMNRLSKLYKQTMGMKLDDAAAFMVAESDKARGAGIQEDDWTFVIVEWKSGTISVA
jgi:ligand-binding sensor domain-containing protein/serine phosphatase RsbU (regulator of sigma subunit)